MSRLPINLPPAAPLRPARGRLRDALFFCIAFAAVFGSALLAMEMMLG